MTIVGDLRITLRKSINGRLEKQKATALSLGLKRVGDATVQPNNPATQGKIAKIRFLIDVAEVK